MQFRPSSAMRALVRTHAPLWYFLVCAACTASLSQEDPGTENGTGGRGYSPSGGAGTSNGGNAAGGGGIAAGEQPNIPLGLFEAYVTPPAEAPDAQDCPAAGTTVQPAEAPSFAFSASCAGCHGNRGQGIGDFPAVSKLSDFAKYLAAVREGRNEKMPAFGSDWLSDADLFRDWVTITGRAAKVPAEIACATTTVAEAWTKERYLEAITRGLQAWRKPDSHEGAACASCHGPAPFDLAYIGYDDATIMRRALLHVSQTDGFAVVQMVHALRAKFGLPARRDFMAFRPFQPGGRVLGAHSARDLRDQEDRAAEADHLFGLELEKTLPTLAGPEIQTVAQAERARKEFLGINPRTFPIAIALNRWTEDKHHGASHASLADWVPDRPHLPRDQKAETAIYAAHDAYLKSPDWQGVLMVENAVAEHAKMAASGAAAELFVLKYRSVLYAQHQFLLEAGGRAGLAEMGPAPFPDRNSVWNVGDFARLHRTDTRACMNMWAGCLGLPSESSNNVDPSRSVFSEFERIKFSWFWVGWQFDVSLYNTSQTNSTIAAEYFLEHLYEHHYYNHAWYMRIRKNLAFAYELQSKAGAPAAGILADGAQNWSYVFAYGRGMNESSLPPAGAQRELYLRMMSNAARMMLRLVNAGLQERGATPLPASVSNLPAGPLVQFLTTHGKGSGDAKLIEELRMLLK